MASTTNVEICINETILNAITEYMAQDFTSATTDYNFILPNVEGNTLIYTQEEGNYVVTLTIVIKKTARSVKISVSRISGGNAIDTVSSTTLASSYTLRISSSLSYSVNITPVQIDQYYNLDFFIGVKASNFIYDLDEITANSQAEAQSIYNRKYLINVAGAYYLYQNIGDIGNYTEETMNSRINIMKDVIFNSSINTVYGRYFETLLVETNFLDKLGIQMQNSSYIVDTVSKTDSTEGTNDGKYTISCHVRSNDSSNPTVEVILPIVYVEQVAMDKLAAYLREDINATIREELEELRTANLALLNEYENKEATYEMFLKPNSIFSSIS